MQRRAMLKAVAAAPALVAVRRKPAKAGPVAIQQAKWATTHYGDGGRGAEHLRVTMVDGRRYNLGFRPGWDVAQNCKAALLVRRAMAKTLALVEMRMFDGKRFRGSAFDGRMTDEEARWWARLTKKWLPQLPKWTDA